MPEVELKRMAGGETERMAREQKFVRGLYSGGTLCDEAILLLSDIVGNDRAPVETSPEEPVVRIVADIIGEVTGKRPVPGGASYYTDGAVLVPALKAPMIICGPGDPGLAHQPNEHVEISSPVQAVRIFTLAAIRLLQ